MHKLTSEPVSYKLRQGGQYRIRTLLLFFLFALMQKEPKKSRKSDPSPLLAITLPADFPANALIILLQSGFALSEFPCAGSAGTGKY